jgi:hypothetical protein
MMTRRFEELIAERYEPQREHTDDEYTVFRLRKRAGTGP